MKKGENRIDSTGERERESPHSDRPHEKKRLKNDKQSKSQQKTERQISNNKDRASREVLSLKLSAVLFLSPSFLMLL